LLVDVHVLQDGIVVRAVCRLEAKQIYKMFKQDTFYGFAGRYDAFERGFIFTHIVYI